LFKGFALCWMCKVFWFCINIGLTIQIVHFDSCCFVKKNSLKCFFFHFKMSNNPIYVVVFLCVWMYDSSWSTYGINIFLHLPLASVVDVNNKIFLLLCKPKVVLLWNISYLDVHPSLGFTCLKHFSKQHITLCWKLFHGISYQLTISFKLPCLTCTNFKNGCFINNSY
jgi:hypothetical protein